MAEKNYLKYELYKQNKAKLSKAMNNEFYFEALLIEYAIIEDRIDSLFRTVGCKLSNSLCRNLNKMRSNPIFTNNKFVRDRITIAFVEEPHEWRIARNETVHALFKATTTDTDFEKIAKDGNDLQKLLDNKVKSIKAHYERLEKKKENAKQ
ncbi:MAG: hypothetical protein IJ666_04745 [Ruminococcus sp.]|nr:hypothetical protein [Ruminococcus sp.]